MFAKTALSGVSAVTNFRIFTPAFFSHFIECRLSTRKTSVRYLYNSDLFLPVRPEPIRFYVQASLSLQVQRASSDTSFTRENRGKCYERSHNVHDDADERETGSRCGPHIGRHPRYASSCFGFARS